MPNTHPYDTSDTIIAATLWLMHRYQQALCARLAREWRAQAVSVSTTPLH